MKRFVYGLVILTVVLGGALAYKLNKDGSTDGPPSSSGDVEGAWTIVAARLASRIATMTAREGDHVEAGTLLATLDCAEPDAIVASAREGIVTAEAQVTALALQAQAASFTAEAVQRQARSSRAGIGSIAAQGENAQIQSDRAVHLNEENVLPKATRENAETTAKDLKHRLSSAREAAKARPQTPKRRLVRLRRSRPR